MSTGTKRIFCYICKEYIEVPTTKKDKDGKQAFKALGHSDEKVAQLPRNTGRRQVA